MFSTWPRIALRETLKYRETSSLLYMAPCRPYPREKELYKKRSPINYRDTWHTPTAFFQVLHACGTSGWVERLSVFWCHFVLVTSKQSTGRDAIL